MGDMIDRWGMEKKMKRFLSFVALVLSAGQVLSVEKKAEKATDTDTATSEMVMLFLRPAGVGADPKVEAKDFYDSIWKTVSLASTTLSEQVDPETGAVGANQSWLAGTGSADISQQTMGLSLVMAGVENKSAETVLLGCRALNFGFKHMQNEDGSFIANKKGTKSLKGTAEFIHGACQAIRILERSDYRTKYQEVLPTWKGRLDRAGTWLAAVSRSDKVAQKLSYAHWAAESVSSLVRYGPMSSSATQEAVEGGAAQWVTILSQLQDESGAFKEGEGFDSIYQAHSIVFLCDTYAHSTSDALDASVMDMLKKAMAWQKERVDDSGRPRLIGNSVKSDEKTLGLMDLAMLIVSFKMWAIVGRDPQADKMATTMLMFTMANINQFDSTWASSFKDGATQGIQSRIPGR